MPLRNLTFVNIVQMSKLPTAGEYGIDNVLDLVTNIYGLSVERRNDEAFFRCVSHSPDYHPSCSVNLVTGYYSCFSCGVGGDIISLGARALNKTKLQVASLVCPTDPQSILTRLSRILESKKIYERFENKTKTIEVPPLDSYDDGPMTYLHRRGFHDETLAHFQVRFVRKQRLRTKNGNKMMISFAIAIPIFDEGVHVGWEYRKTEKSPSWMPKTLYTPGISLGPILFGMHNHPTTVVTEGPLDAMFVHQSAFPCVATFGVSNIHHPKKVSRLCSFKSLILFGDRDEAGVKFVHNLHDLTSDKVYSRIARYRRDWAGKDPNELTQDQVRSAIKDAIPYHHWVMRHNMLNHSLINKGS